MDKHELLNHESEIIHKGDHYIFKLIRDEVWRIKVPGGWLYTRDMVVTNLCDTNDIKHISQTMVFVPDKDVTHELESTKV